MVNKHGGVWETERYWSKRTKELINNMETVARNKVLYA
jgi:hypothetical protein